MREINTALPLLKKSSYEPTQAKDYPAWARFFQVFGEGASEEQVKGQSTKLLKLKTVVNRLVFIDDSPKTWKSQIVLRQAEAHLSHAVWVVREEIHVEKGWRTPVKRALLERTALQYQSASRSHKQRTLARFMSVTGYVRKYAMWVLNHAEKVLQTADAPPQRGEFLNEDVAAYCAREQITFTRGRPYEKRDQCFIEQKNGVVVRQVVGRDRLEGEHAARQLTELYRALRLYVNCFQPSTKLLAAEVIWQKGFHNQIRIRDFPTSSADEPEALGGTNTAPNPVEQLLGALGSCLAIGYTANASLRGIQIEDLRIELEGHIDLPVFLGLYEGHAGYPDISVSVYLKADASSETLEELHQQVLRTSPVGQTIENAIPLHTTLHHL